ncbi:zinc metalloprotease HtpX [uncultured Marinobacter sp.]|jgi:heat shock protein HtpX|uniref:zinc metalloprotease HtpX n=1 Tax=uncultured Marinobacter sp. TaxID=187379 RepID=UPI000C0AD6C0|nr:Zn-dependent protease [Marinobacter sp.]MBI44348.1 Zn-dependent protease [Oceanospirillales bacterium]|tara:strand:- start:5030 stop:5983 length:954 start_codon:yes stop_codon:yes gene_type:complete
MTGHQGTPSTWQRSAWRNRIQSILLILFLLGLVALLGELLFGESGRWLALAAGLIAVLSAPAAGGRLTLAAYRARVLPPQQAPDLWALLQRLAERAELPRTPRLYVVPSLTINAFAVGSRNEPSVAVTEGLLRSLTPREITGVLAHEISHIAHGDLFVMTLADAASRLTSLLSLAGLLLLILALPLMLLMPVDIPWIALILLAVAPQLALLAQLGLSRVREFDADLAAARLTGDPEGLASALAKIERANLSWRGWLLPGWGNPEPSWLRTHPATSERIRRLLALTPAARDWPHHPRTWPRTPEHLQPPRWRPGGIWR